jgi:UDP-2,3-diacylglucosamine hydrolase
MSATANAMGPARLATEIWFVSDVHIRYGDAPYMRRFIAFLEAARGRARVIYVFGDLFEFWTGGRQWRLPFYEPLRAAVAAYTRGGGALRFLRGNRDFLVEGTFVDAGAEILPDEITLSLGGARLHLSHGDQFCIEDRSYVWARRVFRSSIIDWIARRLPAAVGIWLAESYRAISKRKSAKRGRQGYANRFHTVRAGIERHLARAPHDVLICGHIHFRQDAPLEVAGRTHRVITTGAWEEGPNYVAYDGADFGLRTFEPPAAP